MKQCPTCRQNSKDTDPKCLDCGHIFSAMPSMVTPVISTTQTVTPQQHINSQSTNLHNHTNNNSFITLLLIALMSIVFVVLIIFSINVIIIKKQMQGIREQQITLNLTLEQFRLQQAAQSNAVNELARVVNQHADAMNRSRY